MGRAEYMRKYICWYPIITGVGSWQLLLSQIIISLFLGDRLTLFMISMLTSGGVFMDDRLALLLGERLGLFTNISWLLSSADLADSCLAFLPVERLSFFVSTPLLTSGVDFTDNRLILLLAERLGFCKNMSGGDLADSCFTVLPVERLSFFDSTSLPMSGVRWEAPDFLNSCFELCEG